MKHIGRSVSLSILGFLCILATQAPAMFSFQAKAPAAAAKNPQQALMDQYCSGCHNQDDLAGGMALDKLDFEKVGKDAEVWERVVRKVRTGMMPPSGQPRPARSALDAFATELENRLDKAAAANPNVGAPALH